MSAFERWRGVMRALQGANVVEQVHAVVAAAFLLGLEDELYSALVRARAEGERCRAIGSGGR